MPDRIKRGLLGIRGLDHLTTYDNSYRARSTSLCRLNRGPICLSWDRSGFPLIQDILKSQELCSVLKIYASRAFSRENSRWIPR